MINNIIAYKITELKKRFILTESKQLRDSGIIDQTQWESIKMDHSFKLFSPSIFVKILLFVFSLIGMMTIMGPLSLIFEDVFSKMESIHFRVIALILGLTILGFTEKILIQKLSHYKSGIVEAGIYASFSLILFALIGVETVHTIIYPLVFFVFATIAALRYLDLIALILSLFFFSWSIFQALIDIGETAEQIIPFVFMITFSLLLFTIRKLEIKLQKTEVHILFIKQFIIIRYYAFFILYLSGNYFVVKELSINLMGLELKEGADIPLAYFFYTYTLLVPMLFLFFGIKRKSILFIRLGLLCIGLSILTFKYYFSLLDPIIVMSISGALLIVLALAFLNYLKTMKSGFTRERLLKQNWSSKNWSALIASQTLGGSDATNPNEDIEFGGGSFGGGGAGGKW